MALIDKEKILKGLWDVVLIALSGTVCVIGARLAVNHALASVSHDLAAMVAATAAPGHAVAGLAEPISLAAEHPPATQDHSGKKKKEGKPAGGKLESFAYALRTTVVNLAPDSKHRFAKVSITLEPDSKETIAQLEALDHHVYDCLIETLGNVRAQDIGSDAGKDMLKETLRQKMNKFLTDGEILNVYLTEFLVQ